MTRFALTKPKALGAGDVTLRPWQRAYAPALVARLADPEIVAFLDQIPQPYGLADAFEYIARSTQGWREATSTNFAVFVEGIDGAAGSVGIHWLDHESGVAEVGYWVAAEARGRGVATTAVRVSAAWAFAAAPWLTRLQLRADVMNVGSNRVAEKAGFTREGVLRASHWNPRLDRHVDFAMWSLLRDEL